eukprot:1482328-Ditylum_brightwellii.AAC.1
MGASSSRTSSSTSFSHSIPLASTGNHRKVDAFIESNSGDALGIYHTFSIANLSSSDDNNDNDSNIISGENICKTTYLANGNCKRLLLEMVIGLTDENDSFGNTNNKPYKSSKERKNFVPSLKILQEEWTGPNPCLRMYHVLMEDTVREEFLSHNNVQDRQTLDDHNSSSQLPTFYEIVSTKFNDPGFNPTTEALSNLHEYFAHLIKLKFEDAPTPTSPDKVKDKLADVRAKLVILISDWALSGNGGGNRAETDKDFVGTL